jgi:hypothetical protein
MAAATEAWLSHVRDDPRPWLLEDDTPAVRAATLERLYDRAHDDADVASARIAATDVDPIRSILQAQEPDGWWVKPGPGYAPKYRGTVWSLIFLDQLGADGNDPRIQRACEYVLSMTQTASGGLGCSGSHKESPPGPSTVLHCLNGNLLCALIGFGHLDDDRVRAAIEWAAMAITGHGIERWYASGTTGPGFACGANDGVPCAWGALKELKALARIPPRRRTGLVRQAIAESITFLLSRDPALADYPMPSWSNDKPNGSWFKPGFPLGYIGDVLETCETLAAFGYVRDPRVANALTWVESGQDDTGRWPNRHAYNGKVWTTIERQGRPSKWVTLRACAVLRAAHG